MISENGGSYVGLFGGHFNRNSGLLYPASVADRLALGRTDLTGGMLLVSTNTSALPALFVEAATGRIGMATTAPGDIMHLRMPGASAPGIILDNINVNRQFKLSSVGSNIAGAGGFGVYDNTAGGSSRLFIDSVGRVGIGTDTPSTLFQVGTGTLAVTTSGSVGVGTTDPITTLEIRSAKSKTIDGTIANWHAAIWDNTAMAQGVGGGIAFVGYKDSGSSLAEPFAALEGYKENSTSNDASGAFVLRTRANGGATPLQERLRVSSVGNVGIGTTNPISTMTVAGSLGLSAIAAPAVSPTGTGRIYFDSGANVFKVSENGGTYVNLLGAAGAWQTTGSIVNLVNGANNVVVQSTLTVQGNAFSVGGSTFVVNQANVGIGTTNPSAILHVRPGTDQNLWIRGEQGAGVGTGISLSSLNNAGSADSPMELRASKFVFNQGSVAVNKAAPSATLDVSGGALISGNVGIGTTNPTTQLYLNNGAYPQLTIDAASGNSQGIDFKAAGTLAARLATNGNNGGTFFFYSAPLTELARIQGDGRVGIGNVTAPAARLHVSSANAVAADTIFQVSSGTVAGQELMVVKGDGKVGIGTASPGARFHVKTGIDQNYRILGPSVFTTGNRIQILNDASATAPLELSANSFDFHNGSEVSILRLSNTGNVGIGTTNPTHGLTIGGGTDFGGTELKIVRGTTELAASLAGDGSGANWGTKSNSALQLMTNNAEKMRIASGGNVGIGTTNPVSTMTVAGSLGLNGIAAPSVSPAGTGRIYFDSSANVFKVSENGNAYVNLVGGGSSPWQIVGSLVNLVTGTNNVVVQSTLTVQGNSFSVGISTLVVTSGNVGIGIASPARRFEVSGDIGVPVGNSISLHTADTNNRHSLTTTTGDWLTLRATNNNITTQGFRFNRIVTPDVSNDVTLMQIDNTGNVGIGTTNPATKLTVLDGDIRISTTSGSRGIYFQDGSFQTTAAGSSQWTTNGTNISNVNTGNVGIGTTNPGYKLHVAGGNIATDNYLHIASWPGYGSGTAWFWYDGLGGSGSSPEPVLRLGASLGVVGNFYTYDNTG